MNNLRRRQIKGITQKLVILRRELGQVTDEEFEGYNRSENLRAGQDEPPYLQHLDSAYSALKLAVSELESVVKTGDRT